MRVRRVDNGVTVSHTARYARDWGPIDPTTFSIGAVNYTIARDLLSGGVRIDPPGAGGAMGDPQTIRGFVTTVPEPSTYVLMAAGLAAVGLVSRRRRSAQA